MVRMGKTRNIYRILLEIVHLED